MKYPYRITIAMVALAVVIPTYIMTDISQQRTNNLIKAMEIFQESTKISVFDKKKQLEEYLYEVNSTINSCHQKLTNNLKEYNVTFYNEMEKLYLANITKYTENIVKESHDLIKMYINSPQLQVRVKDYVETVATSIKKTNEAWNEVVNVAGFDPLLNVEHMMMVIPSDICNYVTKLIDKNLDINKEMISKLNTENSQLDFENSLLKAANSEMNAIIEGLQKKIEQKSTEDCNRMADDARLVRAIKSQWFSEAEKTLRERDNSTYNYVIGEVYNNQPDNFLLVVNFAEFIRDNETKIKVYHTLYHEITKNKRCNLLQLIRLSKSIQTNMLDQLSNGTEAQSLYETLQKAIELAILPLKNSLSKEEYKITSPNVDSFQCMADTWQEVIKELWSNLTTIDVLARVQNKLTSVEEQIAFHVAVFQKMQQRNEIYSQNAITLARHMKLTTDDAKFQLASIEARRRFEEIKDKLPKSVKNIVFSKTICIRNVKIDEYLCSSDKIAAFPSSGQYLRYVITLPGGNNPTSTAKWTVIFIDNFQIRLLNNDYKQSLLADKDRTTECPSCNPPNHGRSVFLYNIQDSCTIPSCTWNVTVSDDFVTFENKNDLLFVDANIKLEKSGSRVFAHIVDKIDLTSTKWHITDCS